VAATPVLNLSGSHAGSRLSGQSDTEDRMAGFTFKLEHEDGTPADPPVLYTAVPNWNVGDAIPVSAGNSIRVIETHVSDEQLVLVVEPA
jgi:hypothetical protein